MLCGQLQQYIADVEQESRFGISELSKEVATQSEFISTQSEDIQSQLDTLRATQDDFSTIIADVIVKVVNVRTERKLDPGQSTEIQDAVVAAEKQLRETGRVVLRASGTEPVIRVMVEGENAEQVAALARQLADVVEQSAR